MYPELTCPSARRYALSAATHQYRNAIGMSRANKSTKNTSATTPVAANTIPFHADSHVGGTYVSPGAKPAQGSLP